MQSPTVSAGWPRYISRGARHRSPPLGCRARKFRAHDRRVPGRNNPGLFRAHDRPVPGRNNPGLISVREPRSPRVGFLIAGVQKAGTSTLHAALRSHPQVARSKLKELHFFDDDRRDWFDPDYRLYERGIATDPHAVIAGESTPSYVFWPGALERISAYNPRMRLIVSFRDPIERAFSQWCMNKGRDPAQPDFSAAIAACAPTSMPVTVDEAGGRYQSYVARGYYGAQVRRLLDLFDRDQLLFLDFHTAFLDFNETMDRVTDFLGLQRRARSPAPQRARAQPGNLTGRPPAATDIALLTDLFRDDLVDFSVLTGIDVSTWPTTGVATSMVEAQEVARGLATKAGLGDHA